MFSGSCVPGLKANQRFVQQDTLLLRRDKAGYKEAGLHLTLPVGIDGVIGGMAVPVLLSGAVLDQPVCRGLLALPDVVPGARC